MTCNCSSQTSHLCSRFQPPWPAPWPGCSLARLSPGRAVLWPGCPLAGLFPGRAVLWPGCPLAGLSPGRAVPWPCSPGTRAESDLRTPCRAAPPFLEPIGCLQNSKQPGRVRKPREGLLLRGREHQRSDLAGCLDYKGNGPSRDWPRTVCRLPRRAPPRDVWPRASGARQAGTDAGAP